ncbi:MAG: polyprenyl synthetase family protein [Nitriliruptoraceae bacterium]
MDHALTVELDRLLTRLRGYHPELDVVAATLQAFCAGGKRIRPILLLLGHRAGGDASDDAVMGPALALELLHTCALVHDDVIDRADTRRGRPTVHREYASLHADRRLRGDADAFGRAVAILVGDVAFTQADDLFLRARVDDRRLLDGMRAFTALREEVMAGQYLDLVTSTTGEGDRAAVLQVATLKSGRYSVTRPLEVGAVLAGGDATLIEGLRRFGDPLGRAFQVRDDLLGLFGQPESTGKSVQSDLAEGKHTLVIVEALERLDAAGRSRLSAMLGDPALGEDDAAEARALIERCGARSAAEAYVDASAAESLAALDGLEVDEGVAMTLRHMAGRLTDRVS